MSNLPHETKQDDILKLMYTVGIQQIGIKDGVATIKVHSQKDVAEALTYDTKYLYYKEIQVRRAGSDTVIPLA